MQIWNMLEVLRCGHQSSLKAELDFELIQQQPQNKKVLKRSLD